MPKDFSRVSRTSSATNDATRGSLLRCGREDELRVGHIEPALELVPDFAQVGNRDEPE